MTRMVEGMFDLVEGILGLEEGMLGLVVDTPDSLGDKQLMSSLPVESRQGADHRMGMEPQVAVCRLTF